MKTEAFENEARHSIDAAFADYKGLVPNDLMTVFFLSSIAESQKRIADMMEEDRRPVLELPKPDEPTLIERQRAKMIEIDEQHLKTIQSIDVALRALLDWTGPETANLRMKAK